MIRWLKAKSGLLRLIARLVLAGVWIIAAWLKLPDPAASVRAVRAYQLLPEGVVPAVGYGLPFLEMVVGVLLLLGLGVRLNAVLSALMLVAFIAGIASAWGRGLQIECGCFGGGGITTDAAAAYPREIARDAGLLLLAGALIAWPRTPLSLDHHLESNRSASDKELASE